MTTPSVRLLRHTWNMLNQHSSTILNEVTTTSIRCPLNLVYNYVVWDTKNMGPFGDCAVYQSLISLCDEKYVIATLPSTLN